MAKRKLTILHWLKTIEGVAQRIELLRYRVYDEETQLRIALEAIRVLAAERAAANHVERKAAYAARKRRGQITVLHEKKNGTNGK